MSGFIIMGGIFAVPVWLYLSGSYFPPLAANGSCVLLSGKIISCLLPLIAECLDLMDLR